MSYEEVKRDIIDRNKNDWFVQHIQKHLDNGDTGLKLYKLEKGVVGCAICGKSVEQISEDMIEYIEESFQKENDAKIGDEE